MKTPDDATREREKALGGLARRVAQFLCKAFPGRHWTLTVDGDGEHNDAIYTSSPPLETAARLATAAASYEAALAQGMDWSDREDMKVALDGQVIEATLSLGQAETLRDMLTRAIDCSRVVRREYLLSTDMPDPAEDPAEDPA